MSQLHKFNDADDVEQLKHIIEKQHIEILRLNNIINNLPGSIYWKDKEGVYQGRNAYATEKMKTLFLEASGAKEESIIGKTDYDFFSKEVADEYRQHDLEVMQTGKESIKEETVNLPNGEVLIQISSKKPLLDEKNNIIGVIGNTINISELEKIEVLKAAIEQLKFENFQLKNIIENLPGSIYWKNKQGVYQGRNKTGGESLRSMNFSWRLEEVIGKTDYDLFPKEMADGFRKHDLEVMESGKESTQEEITTLATGEKIIQLSTKRPLYDENGNVVGVVGNTVDITYLKKIETELREAKEKAEQANTIKTEFIRNMEHDIRTPFSGVWGLANQLCQRETEPLKKELLEDITHCSKELLDYCNSILDFSRIELGSLAVLEKKFNIKKLIDSVITIEKPPAKLKKLDLILDYDDAIPAILAGDQYRLQRILINLLSNAIKFTKQGYVKLGVKLISKANDKRIIIRFIVEDTGIGIPQEKQDFIYEKFARLNPSNKGTYKGIGLGLRIVRQFMEEMDGEIDLASESGKGSTFICTIPFKLPLVSDMVEND